MFNFVSRHILPVLLLVGPAAHAQQLPKVLVASGKEILVELLSPGELDCVGGQPTGRPLQCSPGTSRILLTNWVSVQGYEDVTGTAAAMTRGLNTIVMHCNLDRNYYGHCWGTFEWEVAEMGGKWQGVWSGIWDFAANRVSYHLTGYGSGGQLEGLRIEKESVWHGGTQSGTFVVNLLAKQPTLSLKEPAAGFGRVDYRAPLLEARNFGR
ncbi:MAG: hypothetical protein HY820_12455 [Acidobacteria bacterium]|nr:hypothetical protein [Acidobacteriota bacterium]